MTTDHITARYTINTRVRVNSTHPLGPSRRKVGKKWVENHPNYWNRTGTISFVLDPHALYDYWVTFDDPIPGVVVKHSEVDVIG